MKKHILFTLLLVVVMSFSATAQKHLIDGIKFSRHHFVDTVKIKIWDGAVIIPVEINGQTRNLLFDSGAIGGGFDLTEDLMRIWADSDPELGQKMDEYTVLKDTTVFTTAGYFGLPSDTVPYRIFHCPEVEMGGITFTDVWVSTDKRTGKVGSSILKHNSLIINGNKRKLVLLPHEGKMVQNVGNKNTVGLKLILADKGDTLGAMKDVVRKDGDAYQKGIRSGDYLESVNGVEITEYCTYLNLPTDTTLRRFVFRTPEGMRKEVEW